MRVHSLYFAAASEDSGHHTRDLVFEVMRLRGHLYEAEWATKRIATKEEKAAAEKHWDDGEDHSEVACCPFCDGMEHSGHNEECPIFEKKGEFK